VRLAEPKVTCLSVVGCSGHPPLKRVLKHLAGSRYIASVPDDDGNRIKLAGHLAPTPENQELFERHQVRAVVIFRDPRDNLTQLVRRTVLGYCPDKFLRPGTHPDAVAYNALVAASEGKRGDAPFVDFYVEGIGGREVLDRIFRVSQWKNHPRVQAVRFEDLIDVWGERPDVPRQTIVGIAEFLGASVTDEELDALEAAGERFLDKRRSGKAGFLQRWQDAFTDEDKASFKRYYGDLLIDLGYETDLDW
jgi:hypothetical protein